MKALPLEFRKQARLLSDEVHDRLLDLLGSEALARNARLPAEEELARRFAVSRPVVRHALARLRNEGHVYSRKGSGTYVRGPARPAAISFEPLHSIPDVRGFLEFRCGVESEMAACAARCADRAALEVLRRSRLRVEDDIVAGRPTTEDDVAFHMSIAQATGNRFFVAMLAALQDHMMSSIRPANCRIGRPPSASGR